MQNVKPSLLFISSKKLFAIPLDSQGQIFELTSTLFVTGIALFVADICAASFETRFYRHTEKNVPKLV
jgi:uncharacterized membrane protein YgdD (TMEM256/DUF423 family)